MEGQPNHEEPPGLVHGAIVLFDGVCNLCNGAVKFIIDHERAPSLKFAALQSPVGERVLEHALGPDRAKVIRAGANGGGDPDSIVLVEDARAFTHSTAALRIARHLRAPWGWLAALALVPRPIRDLAYRVIARNRYRWFGKSESCRVPTPELRARFLSS